MSPRLPIKSASEFPRIALADASLSSDRARLRAQLSQRDARLAFIRAINELQQETP